MAARSTDLEMLAESITSILGQRFEDIEFLIVDDGNPDHILEYLHSVAKSEQRVRLIYNEGNIGLTRSLIRAIQQAEGRYIARQDADDISSLERLEHQVKYMESSKEAVFVGCWYTVIDELGRKTKKTPPNDDRALRKLMFLTNPFCHTSAMFRSNAYHEVNGYDAKYTTTQDLDLWLKLSKVGKMGVVDKFLVERFIHSGSISVSLQKGLTQVKNSIRTRFVNREILQSNMAIPLLALSALYQTVIMLIPSASAGLGSAITRVLEKTSLSR
jgi:glycosyltransferase involved in cell wall biosynthesis